MDTFNGKKNDYLSIFVHAPFKSDLVRGRADKDKNATSIVVQMQLRTKKYGDKKTCIIIGGDADHYVWEQILEKSKKHKNTDKLKWDLFLAPHHCSWTFFNDTKYEDNKTPKDYALEFLSYGENKAHIIASSTKILNDDSNPPCYQAMQEYVKKVGETRFKNTALHKKENAPQPLVYTIDDFGITFEKGIPVVATTLLGSTPPRAG